MARPAPGALPIILPNPDESARLIEKVVNTPRVRLGDARIRDLIETYSDGTPVWLTGSSVWLPAVFGQSPPPDNDFDIVFSNRVACERFVNGALAELNRRVPGFIFTQGKSKLGAYRIHYPGGPGVIDAWALDPGESMAELLMGFSYDYQRCAYYMGRSVAGSGGALTRIVRPVSPYKFIKASSRGY